MEISPSLLNFALLLLACSVSILASGIILFRRRNKIPLLPPGPPSWPIFGNLHLLGKLPHQSLYNLSKVYGPLMYLRLGSVPTIVASSPETARDILQTNDLAFASRPRTTAAVYNHSDVVLAPQGPYWRHARKVCVMELLTARKIESFRSVRVEEVVLLVRSVLEDSNTGKEVLLLSKLLAMSNNIISRMALGRSFSDLQRAGSQDLSKNMVKLLNEAFILTGVFNIGDYIPYVRWMDLQGYETRMKKVKRNLDAVLQEVIDNRRRFRKTAREWSSQNDFLDVLLSLSENSERDFKVTDDCIIGVLLDMFAAGTDTSAVTSEWAVAELLNNPGSMKKAQEELDSVVGHGRNVEEFDIPRLPYLQAVVKETMRLHPPGPLLVPHESTEPCRISGYDIPAKTRAFVNAWAIGRDPTAWERPLHFWPERFLESTVDVRGQHFQLLPFGAGRRGCPGLALGLLNVQLALATLLHSFEWSLPSRESSQKLDMSERFGLTVVMATPLAAVAKPRLPQHLYM